MQTPYFKAFFLSFNHPFLTIPNVISSAPRYDRFDTSPYMFNSSPKAANLWEQPLGTAKNNDIQFFKKARK